MMAVFLAIFKLGGEADAAERGDTASELIQGEPCWKELNIRELSLTESDLPSNLNLRIERNPATCAEIK